jgi:hypothetical protein
MTRDSPVKVVEKRQQVNAQLNPTLSLTLLQNVGVHDVGGIVQTGSRHDWPVHVPMNVVGDQGDVEQQGDPLSGKQEEQIEGEVQQIFGQN